MSNGAVGTAVLTLTILWSPNLLGSDIQVCFNEAGSKYHIAPDLLRVIGEQESGLDPDAMNVNINGSVDIGLMQINSRWFDDLQSYGIDIKRLWEPCTNIWVGAWILAGNVASYGYTWKAVGAYNAGTAKTEYAEARRRKYAEQIANRLGVTIAAGGM